MRRYNKNQLPQHIVDIHYHAPGAIQLAGDITWIQVADGTYILLGDLFAAHERLEQRQQRFIELVKGLGPNPELRQVIRAMVSFAEEGD